MALTEFTTHRAALKPVARRAHPLSTFFAVWKSRRALARLDARALEDVGLTKDRAAQEAAKPIWDVPATWRD
ncbi:MAG: DUF1127 domain-containing protein [Pseudomonadota bacterium]